MSTQYRRLKNGNFDPQCFDPEISWEGDVYKEFEALVNHLETSINKVEVVNQLKDQYGEVIPVGIVVRINSNERYLHPRFIDQATGIPLDWHFYAGLREITRKDIAEEENIEKRRLLVLKFGPTRYYKKFKVISEDIYGQLVELPDFEGVKQRMVIVRDGTKHDFLKGVEGATEDGRKIYYIPTTDDCPSPMEAVGMSWAMNEEPPAELLKHYDPGLLKLMTKMNWKLKPTGWDFEA